MRCCSFEECQKAMRLQHWYPLIQTFFTAYFWDWTSLQDDKLYLIFLPIIIIKVHIKFIYIILAFIVIFVFVHSQNRKRWEIRRVCGGGPLLTSMLFRHGNLFYNSIRVYEETNIHKRLNVFVYFWVVLLTRARFHVYSRTCTMHLRYQRDKVQIHVLVICAPDMQCPINFRCRHCSELWPQLSSCCMFWFGETTPQNH